MPPVTSLNPNTAIPIWNKFLSSTPSYIPFSFNPSLFYFYTNYFQWKPYYFIVFSQEIPFAIFPLVNTGKSWVSLPHFSYGGGIIKNEKIAFSVEELIYLIRSFKLSPGFYRLDIEGLISLSRNIKEKYFVRTIFPHALKQSVKSEKVTSVLQLPLNKEVLWYKINSNLRRKINKAIKSSFIVKSGGIHLLDDFYDVYSKNIFELHSLCYDKQFFINLFLHYKYGDIKFFIVYNYNEKPVGSSLLVSYHGFYENLYFATAKEVRKFYVSDYIHWEMINYAMKQEQKEATKNCNRNSVYSFGRSSVSSGVYNYKHHWPVTDYPIFVYSNRGDVRQHSWLSVLWGRLPYSLSLTLGAKLIKHIY